MPEIVNHCPLCSSDSKISFDRRDFRGYTVYNVICKRCGLVYQASRMSVAESQSFYEAEYRRLYQGQEGPSTKDLAVQAKRAQVTLEFTRPYISACARILDIGCSSGILLRQFRDHFQSQVTGIEPGTSYRRYAHSLGLEVFSSLEEVEQQGLSPFNLVSMMHVLEHLPEPVQYLQNLRLKHLTPHGWLLLEVPNLYAHDCFEVAHLVSFSPHTLTQVVEKAGYRVVRQKTHGEPRSKLIPLYLTLLAQPDSTTHFSLRPDHLVRARRTAGFLYRRIVTRLFPRQAWLSPEKTE